MNNDTAVTARAPAPANSQFKVANVMGGEMRGDVSRQWMSRPADQRFLSLEELRTSVRARADVTAERRVDTNKVEFFTPDITSKDDLNKLLVGLPGGDIVAPTSWSFGQVAGLVKAPTSYLKTLPTPIVADALNYGMRYARSVEEIKTYCTPEQMLAVTGPDYGRIYDWEVVEAIMEIAGPDSVWKIPGVMNWQTSMYNPDAPVTLDSTTLYASDRDIFIFLVDDRNPIEIGKTASGEPDLIFRGFYITNSEVGSGSLKIAAFYLRAVCQNRNLWGVEGFQELRMNHTKYAPSRFMAEARPALASFANGSERKLIDGVNKAKAAQLAKDDDEALAFLKARAFSGKRALDILATSMREEQRPARSAWDFAQAITANARLEQNNDTRIELEREAGKLLDLAA